MVRIRLARAGAKKRPLLPPRGGRQPQPPRRAVHRAARFLQPDRGRGRGPAPGEHRTGRSLGGAGRTAQRPGGEARRRGARAASLVADGGAPDADGAARRKRVRSEAAPAAESESESEAATESESDLRPSPNPARRKPPRHPPRLPRSPPRRHRTPRAMGRPAVVPVGTVGRAHGVGDGSGSAPTWSRRRISCGTTRGSSSARARGGRWRCERPGPTAASWWRTSKESRDRDAGRGARRGARRPPARRASGAGRRAVLLGGPHRARGARRRRRSARRGAEDDRDRRERRHGGRPRAPAPMARRRRAGSGAAERIVPFLTGDIVREVDLDAGRIRVSWPPDDAGA